MFGGSLDFLLNVKGQILGLIGYTVLFGISTRGDLLVAARMILCKREFNERRKGRNIIEFLFLTNFKDVIPKAMFIWYYSQLSMMPIGLMAIMLMAYIGESKEKIIWVTLLVALIMGVPTVIYSLVFEKQGEYKGSELRFIPRKHVVTKKHTQPQRNSNRPKKNTKSKKK